MVQDNSNATMPSVDVICISNLTVREYKSIRKFKGYKIFKNLPPPQTQTHKHTIIVRSSRHDKLSAILVLVLNNWKQ